MPKKKTKKIILRVTPEQFEKIHRLAEYKDTTVSAILRRFINSVTKTYFIERKG